jgi:hypothetical protein
MLIKSKLSGWLADGTRTPFLGGGGGGGSPAPAPSSQTVTQTSIPEYAQPYVETMLGQSQALTDINQNPYQTYGGQRIADFNPVQQQAFNTALNRTSASQLAPATGLAAASGFGSLGIAGQMAGAGQDYAQQATNPFAQQAYMSPYIQNALQPQLAEMQRQYDITGLQQKRAATGAGAFGGTRDALMRSENERNKNIAMNQAIGSGYQDAFKAAQQAQQFGANLGLQGYQGALSGLGQASQAAGQLGQLGQAQFGQESALTAEAQKIGALQQAQAQQGLDLGYQDFLKQKNYPYQQLAFMSDMLRGLPLSQSAQQVYTAPPSTASQLGGAGLSALGIYGMSGGFKANGGMVGKGYAEGGQVGYATGGDIKMMNTKQLQQLLENPGLTPLESDMVEKELMLRRRMEMNPESDKIMAGITSIPTGNMVPMEGMAGGGIVAFAKGDKVTDKFAEYEDMMMADIKRRQQAMEATDPFAAAKAREAQIEARLAKSQETAPYRAMAMAGLGTMAGTSQYGLTNAAFGGLEGLKSYAGSQREVEDANKLLLQQAGEREKSQFARESALLGSQQTALGQMLGRRASAEATAASRAATANNQSNADYVRAQNSFNTLLSSARTDLSKRAKPGGTLYKKYKDDPDQLERDAQEIARNSMSPDLLNKLDIPKLKMPTETVATPSAKGAPKKITTQEEYNKLKSGERYIDPKGQIRTKS